MGAGKVAAHQADPLATVGDLPKITLTANVKVRFVIVEPRTTLVEALRDNLGLTGTKFGCNQGQCGACKVLLNGRRVVPCPTLAIAVDGSKVVTVEGLADVKSNLHPT